MVQHLKAELRKSMLAKRLALWQDYIEEAGKKIFGRLCAEEKFKKAQAVAFYFPINNEVNTTTMIREAAKTKEILLPVTNHEIALFTFTSFDELKIGKYGIMEPSRGNAATREPDVIIVPGVAFGICMQRLGYGKGYYDRLLRKLPSYRIGLAYDFQVVEELPQHKDDERMDIILTEKRRITL